MKYLFIQCFCIINVSFEIFAFSSIVDRKSSKGEIDDFIRQLLTSKKFDELADKIAEKAVDKIIKFEQGAQESEIHLKTNLRTKNTTNAQEARHVHKEKEKAVQHEESIEQSTKQPDDEKTTSSKVGKINMQAFIKKDASLKSEKLSLKYKYLTEKSNKKDIQGHKDKKHKQPDDGSMVLRNNDDVVDEKYSEHEEDRSEPYETDNKSQEYEDVLDISNDENSLDKSLIAAREREEDKVEHYYDNHEMTNIYHKDDDDDNMKGHSDNETGEEQQYEDTSMVNHDNDGKNVMRFSEVREKIKNVTIRTQETENKTDEPEKVEHTSHSNEIKDKEVETLDHEDDGSKDNEDSNENNITTQDITKNDTLNRVRMEGSKKFKFQSSAEYMDYLEEYDKNRKENPEKDFL